MLVLLRVRSSNFRTSGLGRHKHRQYRSSPENTRKHFSLLTAVYANEKGDRAGNFYFVQSKIIPSSRLGLGMTVKLLDELM